MFDLLFSFSTRTSKTGGHWQWHWPLTLAYESREGRGDHMKILLS